MIKRIITIMLLLFLNACSSPTKPILLNANMIRLGYDMNYGDQSFDNYIFHNKSVLLDFAKNLGLSYRLILIDSITFNDLQYFLTENKVDNRKEIEKGYSKEFFYVLADTTSLSKIGEKIHILAYVEKLNKYFETIENEKDRKQLVEMCDYINKVSEKW